MRKYHRWISVLFGVFLLWISVTGVLSQVGSLVNNGGFEDEAAERAAPPPVPAGFVCPPDMMCRPKPVEKPGQWNVGFLHHIHSGEQFGPVGVVISILSGLALLFFSFSGLWMYVQMWRNRSAKNLKPGWFWK
jgi:uncharacterized iron-regulated membrane protein